MLKVSTATGIGFVLGLGIGVIATRGGQLGVGSSLAGMIQRYAWPIVVLSMLVPLVDYLKGMRTSVVGSLTGHPFHQLAGFFLGVAAGLGLFLLFITRLL